MAGLPKKYAKMGFKAGWAAYKRTRGGRKTKAKTATRKTAKKVTKMARLRSPKRLYRRFKARRHKVIPLADTLMGLDVVDALTDSAVRKIGKNAMGALDGSMSAQAAVDTSKKDISAGAKYLLNNSGDALMKGGTTFAKWYLGRKIASLILPASIKIPFTKKRLQIR